MESSDVRGLITALQKLEKRIAALENAPKDTGKTQTARSKTLAAARLGNPDERASQILGAVAIFCFVLAASFVVKLALEFDWLTPDRQFAAAMTFGAVLIGMGYRFRGHDTKYLGFLAAAGVIILYLASYAGSVFFHLFNPWVAALISASISLLSLALSRVFNSSFYVVTSVVGSYLVPVLVPPFREDTLAMAATFLFWDVTFAMLAIVMRSRIMLLIATNFAIGTFAIVHQGLLVTAPPSNLVFALIFEAVQLAIFMAANIVFSLRTKASLTLAESWSLFPALLFFYGVEYYFLSQMVPSWAPWISLIFSFGILGSYLLLARGPWARQLASAPVTSGFLTVMFFHSVYLRLLPSRLAPWSALCLVAALPVLFKRPQLLKRHWVAEVAVSIVLFIEFFRTFIAYGDFPHSEWIALNWAFAATLFVGYLMTRRERGSFGIQLAFLGFGSSQAMVGLYRASTVLADAIFHPTVGPLLTSVSWAGFGLGLIAFAWKRTDALLARSSLFVFLIAAAKVFLLDVASAGAIARIGCLLVLGFSLYLGGFLFRKMGKWKPESIR